MPFYDYRCLKCGNVKDDVFIALEAYSDHHALECEKCGILTNHEIVVNPPAVEDWGQGRYFENLSARGETFYDKRSYKEYLKRNHLVEWSSKTGMPGSGV